MTALDHALIHAECGIRVFPVHGIRDGRCTCGKERCEHPGKHPRITGWQEKATCDQADIREWWHKWPDANIAGLTGDLFVVLDIDPRNGGEVGLEAAIAKYGELPIGPTAKTGGGGMHFYFAAPIEPTRSLSGFCKESPGLDFKGQGSKGHPSYIVLPGSNHISGGQYDWMEGSSFDASTLPDLPEWILQAVRSRGSKVKDNQVGSTFNSRGTDTIPIGKRNEVLTSLAGAMRAKGFSGHALLAALRAENEVRCIQPLPDTEIQSIVHSVEKYDANDAPEIPSKPNEALCTTLDRVCVFINSFVLFPTEAEGIAVTLWIALTHCWLQVDVVPYLAITSATPRCGKSLLIDLLTLLCNRAERLSTPTPSVVFRLVDSTMPTLLADEIDTIFGPKTAQNNEELRGVWNEGNRRGSYVYRNETKGKGYELKKYFVFCPKAFGGIGKLPATLADRSIPIRLRRKKKEETRRRFRLSKITPEALPLRQELERQGAHINLAEDTSVPEQLDDRASEFWECLLAIADAAGGHWPEKARKAALFLSGGRDDDDESYSMKLLSDCRSVFSANEGSAIATAELIKELREMSESPWAEFGKNGLTAQGLGKLLREFAIHSKNIRISGTNSVLKGYDSGDFTDSFERYLPNLADPPATQGVFAATALQNGVLESGSEGGECSGVADQHLYVADDEEFEELVV
jgi:hypothetical protein